jgi:hypothetical protein
LLASQSERLDAWWQADVEDVRVGTVVDGTTASRSWSSPYRRSHSAVGDAAERADKEDDVVMQQP